MELIRSEVQAAQMFLKLYDSEIGQRPLSGESSVTLENVSLSLDIARRLLPRLNPHFAETVGSHLKEIEAKLAERANGGQPWPGHSDSPALTVATPAEHS